MLFTERLYKETKDDHKNVDNHPFTKLIKLNKDAGDMYINFNKMCIYQIKKHVLLHDTELQNELYKQLVFEFDFNQKYKVTENVSTLLFRCGRLTLEHAYMFILGLILGGNLLKKYISEEHHSFLTFDNPNKLSKQLKTYLNENVIDEDDFILNVKESYKLIKNIFDEYYHQLN